MYREYIAVEATGSSRIVNATVVIVAELSPLRGEYFSPGTNWSSFDLGKTCTLSVGL